MRFSHFVLRRWLYSVLVLFGLSILIFIIARMLPGNPARLALGPFALQEQVEHLQHLMGMDKPLPLQYWTYITGMFRGDFGLSFQTRRNVALDIAHYLPATVELVLIAIVWVLVLGVPLGVLAARYKDSWPDNLVRVMGDALKHIILPSFAIAMTGIGQIARLTRASMSDVANQDYIEASRGFGIPNRVIAFKYMLKPASIPPLTILGLTFASELSNAFLVETVFAWPGIAKYGIRAILRKDFNAVMGVVLIIGLAFVIVNLIVDILAGYVDPRIRIKHEEGE